MTQDFKKNIINYLTNNYETTEGTTGEIFTEIVSSPDWSGISGILPSNYMGLVYTGMVAPNEEISSIGVLYGYYTKLESGETHYYGIITLVDENFKPIKSFFKTKAGSTLRPIYAMGQDSDYTFYYVDKQFGANEPCRLVMTNNFTIKNDTTNNYELVGRKTYAFGSSYRDFYCKRIFKNPSTSHYIFFGNYFSNREGTTRIVNLKINVGSDNEWSQYTSTTYHFIDAIATFDSSDQVRYRALVCNQSNHTVYSLDKGYTATNPSATSIHAFTTDCDLTFNEDYCAFVNYNKVYFTTHNQFRAPDANNHARFIGLYCYDYSASEFSTIYNKSLGNLGVTVNEEIVISQNQGELYIQYNYDFNSAKNKCKYSIQRLVNDTWSPKDIDPSRLPYGLSYRRLYVKNNFNLLQIYLYNGYIPSTNISVVWFQCVIKENYNPYNYNGEEYNDYNSMKPKQGTLYSNNKLIFARNLYNLTINDNQTNATVVVPNTYLNDISIDEKDLVSETNSNIIADTETLTKNIYETLYINFINNISVYDENAEAYRPVLASYINTNINTGTQANCNDTFIGKAIIHGEYVPSGQTVDMFITLGWEKVDDTHYQTSIALDTTNYMQPRMIQFVSNDFSTVYTQIEENLSNRGIIIITQKIKIE